MITVKKEFDVVLTPQEVANEFWGMGSDEQATFFEELHKITKKRGNLPMQLQYVIESNILKSGGRRVMALIGEYSNA